MNYATWKLNFETPEYGTGPEDAIIATGNTAQGAWSNGEVTDGGTILGYVGAPVNESTLTEWDVKNITEAEALEFCQAINADAYLQEDGRIAVPEVDVQL